MVDGKRAEGTFRAHQVPLSDFTTKPKRLKPLEAWMKSCRPEDLFDKNGKLIPELAELAPQNERRMGANPHANGGLLLHELKMPEIRNWKWSRGGTQKGKALAGKDACAGIELVAASFAAVPERTLSLLVVARRLSGPDSPVPAIQTVPI